MTALATTSMAIDSEPHLEFNVKEWSYLAEGGFHLILRYDGPDPNLQGKILRIGKKSLGHEAAAPTTVGNEGTVAPAASASTLDEAGARRRFERGVLMPLLGKQYVQPGDAVMITTDDIRSIHESFDELRPAGRIDHDLGKWSTVAQVEPDKTAFWLKLPARPIAVPPTEPEHKHVVIAIEIKPKGAVMPVGALVPAANRLKYRVPRFDAQQKFKAQEGEQNWGTMDHATGYHPMELFSGDARRAAATLKELMKTPQNKLRAWEEGTMIFGAGSGGDGTEADAAGAASLGKAVERAGLNAPSEDGTCAEHLMDLVGEILAREPLISRLVTAKELDVLEVEGGGLVFERFVSLCNGSRDDALDLLEHKEADPFTAEEVPPELLLPKEKLAALRAGSDVDGMDDLYSKAVARVETLSMDECIQLLRRYLIALGVMDCSVMMSLMEVPKCTTAIQTHNTAGVLEMADGRCLAYCISVVDAGPKPPTKLRKKAQHEHKIWEFMSTLS